MPISDYTINNLFLHLKALDALGLWKSPTWDDVAEMLGERDPGSSLIDDINYKLIGKISEELDIDPDDEESPAKAASVLRLKKRNPNLADIIDAFYWRQHSRRLKCQVTFDDGESVEMPEDIPNALHQIYPWPPEEAKKWFTEPNVTLGGARPIDFIKRGELDDVRSELDRLLDEHETREQERFEKELAERNRVAARRRWNPFWHLLNTYETRRLRKMVKTLDEVVPGQIETFRW